MAMVASSMFILCIIISFSHCQVKEWCEGFTFSIRFTYTREKGVKINLKKLGFV